MVGILSTKLSSADNNGFSEGRTRRSGSRIGDEPSSGCKNIQQPSYTGKEDFPIISIQ